MRSVVRGPLELGEVAAVVRDRDGREVWVFSEDHCTPELVDACADLLARVEGAAPPGLAAAAN